MSGPRGDRGRAAAGGDAGAIHAIRHTAPPSARAIALDPRRERLLALETGTARLPVFLALSREGNRLKENHGQRTGTARSARRKRIPPRIRENKG